MSADNLLLVTFWLVVGTVFAAGGHWFTTLVCMLFACEYAYRHGRSKK